MKIILHRSCLHFCFFLLPFYCIFPTVIKPPDSENLVVQYSSTNHKIIKNRQNKGIALPENDSLALVALHQATHGNGPWTNEWDLSTPMDTWHGVTVNENGCVTCLDLDGDGDCSFDNNPGGNNLSGTIPVELGTLSNLTTLYLSNNDLTGTIPNFSSLNNLERLYLFNNRLNGEIPDFSNLSSLEWLYLYDNDLSGQIPDFSNLSQLKRLHIQNNDFTGVIPNFSNLPFLTHLLLQKNDLEGAVPNFSGLDSLERLNLEKNSLSGAIPDLNHLDKLNELYLGNNDLTDTIPSFLNLGNLEILYLGNNNMTGGIPSFSHLSNLRILGLSNNSLTGPIPSSLEDLQNLTDIYLHNNQLSGCFPISFSESLCNVNNNDFSGNPLLPWQGDFTQFCETPNEQVGAPCDDGDASTSNDNIDLNCLCNGTNCTSSINNINQILCPGDFILVNGNIFDLDTPTGLETIIDGNSSGCDSTIFINLTFENQVVNNLSPTLCPGENVLVNGNTYDEITPIGSEAIIGGSVSGCDSIINVNLSFSAPITFNLEQTLCFGQSISVNGNTYDEVTFSGTEVFFNLAQNGCDSTVFINLTFENQVVNNLSPTLCPEESIIVNGNTFNIDTPTGEETFIGGSTSGCDSTVFVDLSFFPESINDIILTLCPAEDTIINSILYNELNLSGLNLIEAGSFTGCDSTITINLSYYPDVESTFDPILCFDESVIINNVLYNQNNPTGTEILSNQSFEGCDSTVNINLSFYDEVIHNINSTLCAGEVLEVNGTFYNELNPDGQEIVENGSSLGCDSTINVQLTFHTPLALSNIDSSICDGQTVMLGGQVFDESGNYNFTLQNMDDCDSLQFNLDLTVFSNYDSSFTEVICEGESISIGSFTFDSTDIYTVNLNTFQGCDSIVTLDLMVSNEATFGIADAGEDVIECLPNSILNGSEGSSIVQGYWEGPAGVNIENLEMASTAVNALQDGKNLFIWSLFTEGCPDFSSDSVILILDTIHPTTLPDLFAVQVEQKISNFNPLANDKILGLENWTIKVLDFPTNGQLQQNNDSLFTYLPNDNFRGLDSFIYVLCNEYCDEYCSETVVYLDVKSYLDELDEVDIIITPNNDGKNDRLIIDVIEDYPNNQLYISNRWGSHVYSAAPYQNEWYGQNQNGGSLPNGTYYFIVKLDVGQGEFIRGSVTVQR